MVYVNYVQTHPRASAKNLARIKPAIPLKCLTNVSNMCLKMYIIYTWKFYIQKLVFVEGNENESLLARRILLERVHCTHTIDCVEEFWLCEKIVVIPSILHDGKCCGSQKHILYIYLYMKNQREIFSEKIHSSKSSNRKIADRKRNLEVNEWKKCSLIKLKNMAKGGGAGKQ